MHKLSAEHIAIAMEMKTQGEHPLMIEAATGVNQLHICIAEQYGFMAFAPSLKKIEVKTHDAEQTNHAH